MAGSIGSAVNKIGNKSFKGNDSVGLGLEDDSSFTAIFHRITESAEIGKYIGSHRFQIVESTIRLASSEGKLTLDQTNSFLDVLKVLKDKLKACFGDPHHHMSAHLESLDESDNAAPATLTHHPYELFANFTLVHSEKRALNKLVADFDKAKVTGTFTYSQITIFQAYVVARTDYVEMLEALQAAISGKPREVKPINVSVIPIEEAPPLAPKDEVPVVAAVVESPSVAGGPGSTDTALPVEAVS